MIEYGNDRVQISDDALERIHNRLNRVALSHAHSFAFTSKLNTGVSFPKRFFRSSSINSTVMRERLFSRACFSTPFFTMARRKYGIRLSRSADASSHATS